jgi:hypothetical protein
VLSELNIYADEWPEVVNLVKVSPERFFVDEAEQEDAHASLDWRCCDDPNRAGVEGKRACQGAS